jgi:hypothetical protein
MKRFGTLVCLSISLMFALSAVSATIEQNREFSNTQSLSAILTFDRYNRAEPLQSVAFVLTVRIDGGYLIPDNDNNSPVAADVELGFSASLESQSVTLLDDSLRPVIGGFKVSTTRILRLEADDGDGWQNVKIDGPDAGRVDGSAKSATAQTDIGRSFIGSFSGDGTMEIKTALRPVFDFGNNSYVEGLIGIPNAKATLRLIYTY